MDKLSSEHWLSSNLIPEGGAIVRSGHLRNRYVQAAQRAGFGWDGPKAFKAEVEADYEVRRFADGVMVIDARLRGDPVEMREVPFVPQPEALVRDWIESGEAEFVEGAVTRASDAVEAWAAWCERTLPAGVRRPRLRAFKLALLRVGGRDDEVAFKRSARGGVWHGLALREVTP